MFVCDDITTFVTTETPLENDYSYRHENFRLDGQWFYRITPGGSTAQSGTERFTVRGTTC